MKRCIDGHFRVLGQVFCHLGILAVVGMGAYLLQTESTLLRQILCFPSLRQHVYEPVRQLVSINNLIAAGKASGERVFEVLDTPNEIENHKYPVDFPQRVENIEFKNVSLSTMTETLLLTVFLFRCQRVRQPHLLVQLAQEKPPLQICCLDIIISLRGNKNR